MNMSAISSPKAAPCSFSALGAAALEEAPTKADGSPEENATGFAPLLELISLLPEPHAAGASKGQPIGGRGADKVGTTAGAAVQSGEGSEQSAGGEVPVSMFLAGASQGTTELEDAPSAAALTGLLALSPPRVSVQAPPEFTPESTKLPGRFDAAVVGAGTKAAVPPPDFTPGSTQLLHKSNMAVVTDIGGAAASPALAPANPDLSPVLKGAMAIVTDREITKVNQPVFTHSAQPPFVEGASDHSGAASAALPEVQDSYRGAMLVARPGETANLAPGLVSIAGQGLETFASNVLPAGQTSGTQQLDQAVAHQLDLAHEGEWLDQLATDIARTASKEGMLRFRLHPESLGSLEVEVSQGPAGTSIRMNVETEAARAVLAEAQPRLIAEARAQGARIADTQVDIGLGGQPGTGEHRSPLDRGEEPSVRVSSSAPDQGEDQQPSDRDRGERYA